MKLKYLHIRPIILILFLGIIVSNSCNKTKPECGDPRNYVCRIEIVDTNGNNLIGIDKKFKPDSIFFIIDSTKWYIPFNYGQLIWVYSNGDRFNSSNYLLHLAYNVIDTIKMTISKQSNECFDSYSVQKFTYNDKIISPQTIEGSLDIKYHVFKN